MKAPQDVNPPPIERVFPPDATILVVEDEALIAWDVEQMLRDRGAGSVLVASSLKAARSLLSSHQGIGAALIDIKLEDGSGADLMAEMAALGIPTIITTGYDYRGDGRVPVFHKPYSADALVAAVLDAINA